VKLMERSERVLTSEKLRHLQEIFAKTCDELGIERASEKSRAFLARLLIGLGEDAEDAPMSAHQQLLARGRCSALSNGAARSVLRWICG
jgi:hypothetical protein